MNRDHLLWRRARTRRLAGGAPTPDADAAAPEVVELKPFVDET
jgi:hypothetical protein